jgi:hypothetical protein
MEWSRSTCITAVLLLLPRLCSSAGDQMELGESLLPGQTVVSDGGAFALGFFSPSNATPARQYIGIWYNSIPGRTVVWVGNRDAPVTVDELSVNNSSTVPSLSLGLGNNLVLSDGGGRVVWTANMTTSSSAPNGSTTAVLLNTGNLVLRSTDGATLWQSFDHPTDTIIPDMKVGLRRRPTRDAWRVVSWKAPGDPSPGSFSYGMDRDTMLQMLVWNGTRRHWRSTPWTGYMTLARYYNVTGTTLYVAVVDGVDAVYMSFSVSDGASPMRYVVTDTGMFQLLGWSSNASAWATLESWPSSWCSAYAACGPYGYCDLSGFPAAACRCLDGFEPASRGAFSQGCRRVHALMVPCGGNDDEFLAFRNMKVPDRFVFVGNKSSDAECEAECRRDCSCVAYAFANLRSSSAKGDVSRCLTWTEAGGGLLDAQMIGDRWGVTADTLYLRVPSSPPSGSNPIHRFRIL